MSDLEKLFALAQNCALCPRQCGVNRPAGEKGFCNATDELFISYIGLHHGEEPPISGARGSGTIFFGHCTMACVFCQNWQISQPDTGLLSTEWQLVEVSDKKILKKYTPEELAEAMLNLQKLGAHNINFVSPTQYAPWIYQAWTIARNNGLRLPIVYNTNGYERVEVLELLGDMIDIYLPDMKYENISAGKYSGTPDYAEYNLSAIKFMFLQKGLLQTEAEIATQGIIVRHLVLPTLAEESKNILDKLQGLNPQLHISLMSQYAPQYKAENFPELNRKLTAEEYDEVVAHAESLGLENIWTQETDSQEIFVPDFREEQPFR